MNSLLECDVGTALFAIFGSLHIRCMKPRPITFERGMGFHTAMLLSAVGGGLPGSYFSVWVLKFLWFCTNRRNSQKWIASENSNIKGMLGEGHCSTYSVRFLNAMYFYLVWLAISWTSWISWSTWGKCKWDKATKKHRHHTNALTCRCTHLYCVRKKAWRFCSRIPLARLMH